MYHIIVNSHNLKGKANERKLNTVKHVFDRAGKDYTLHFTEYAGHAKILASELSSAEKEAIIIAMGGDGTLHEVLNGIKDTSSCILGLIPFGSGNDFAASVGIPADNVKYAAETIAFRAPSHIDYIELSDGLRSINAVGFGMDVDVLKRTYAGRGKGKGKYYRSFLKSLFSYKAQKFTVDCEEEKSEHFGLIVCLGNGRQIGGGIKLFPKARPDDGYMDLLIVDYLSRRQTLSAFIKLSLGRLDRVKQVRRVRCKSAEIYPENELYTIQAEGELYEYSQRMNAKLISEKLRFYLPEND